MDAYLLRRLLAQGESSHLDYKAAQYPLAAASIGDKEELLKDILAMANAERDCDAFILIGVRETDRRSGEVVGITEHLDDADLQEFINKKTNQSTRPRRHRRPSRGTPPS